MTSEQFQRVKELFAALEPLPVEERQLAIEARCGNDSVVRTELEKLLDRSDDAQTALRDVTGTADGGIRMRVDSGPPEMGRRVGPSCARL